MHVNVCFVQVNNEETWKSLEESEKRLMDMVAVKDYNVSGLFLEDKVSGIRGSVKD